MNKSAGTPKFGVHGLLRIDCIVSVDSADDEVRVMCTVRGPKHSRAHGYFPLKRPMLAAHSPG